MAGSGILLSSFAFMAVVFAAADVIRGSESAAAAATGAGGTAPAEGDTLEGNGPCTEPCWLSACAATNVSRALEGRGAHRALRFRFRVSCRLHPGQPPQGPGPGALGTPGAAHTGQEQGSGYEHESGLSEPTKSQGGRQILPRYARFLIEQPLPREIFVDPFEVQRSPRAGLSVSLQGPVELEKPATLCGPTSLTLGATFPLTDSAVPVTWGLTETPLSASGDGQGSDTPGATQRCASATAAEDGGSGSRSQQGAETSCEGGAGLGEWLVEGHVDVAVPLHARYPEVPPHPQDAPGGSDASSPGAPLPPGCAPGSPWEALQSWPCTASHMRALLEAPAMSVGEGACCSAREDREGEGATRSDSLTLQAAERALGRASEGEGAAVTTRPLVAAGVPELPWLIPVGCAAHVAFVNMATAAAALLGAACVVYYSTTQSFVARR